MARYKQSFASYNWATSDCPSGKRGWPTRRGAKDFNSRVRRKGGDRLNPYQCADCNMWHLGHLPPVVKEGLKGRREVYP